MNHAKFEVTSFNKTTEQYQERNMKLAVDAGFEEPDLYGTKWNLNSYKEKV